MREPCRWLPDAPAILLPTALLLTCCSAGGTPQTAGTPATVAVGPAPPAARPWPLLYSTPTPCPTYTYPPGPVRAWPTVDPQNLASLANFDPCAVRHPKTATALRPTGGPYIGQDDLIARVTASGPSQWTKIRAYLVTYAAAQRLVASIVNTRRSTRTARCGWSCCRVTGARSHPAGPAPRRRSPATVGASTTRPLAVRTAAAARARTAATGPPFLPDD
jgi:hypothetical protein